MFQLNPIPNNLLSSFNVIAINSNTIDHFNGSQFIMVFLLISIRCHSLNSVYDEIKATKDTDVSSKVSYDTIQYMTTMIANFAKFGYVMVLEWNNQCDFFSVIEMFAFIIVINSQATNCRWQSSKGISTSLRSTDAFSWHHQRCIDSGYWTTKRSNSFLEPHSAEGRVTHSINHDLFRYPHSVRLKQDIE